MCIRDRYVQYVYLHLMGEPLLHPELSSFFALAGARGMKVDVYKRQRCTMSLSS